MVMPLVHTGEATAICGSSLQSSSAGTANLTLQMKAVSGSWKHSHKHDLGDWEEEQAQSVGSSEFLSLPTSPFHVFGVLSDGSPGQESPRSGFQSLHFAQEPGCGLFDRPPDNETDPEEQRGNSDSSCEDFGFDRNTPHPRTGSKHSYMDGPPSCDSASSAHSGRRERPSFGMSISSMIPREEGEEGGAAMPTFVEMNSESGMSEDVGVHVGLGPGPESWDASSSSTHTSKNQSGSGSHRSMSTELSVSVRRLLEALNVQKPSNTDRHSGSISSPVTRLGPSLLQSHNSSMSGKHRPPSKMDSGGCE